jgi:hypothetical protein
MRNPNSLIGTIYVGNNRSFSPFLKSNSVPSGIWILFGERERPFWVFGQHNKSKEGECVGKASRTRQHFIFVSEKQAASIYQSS